MKIQIRQMREHEPLVLDEDLDPADWDLDIGVMRFPDKIKLQAEAWKSGTDLAVRAHIEGVRRFTCSLCLEEFNNLFEKGVDLHYDIKGLDVVSIDEAVREEILLDHPIRILCRDDCRGLCSACGMNLNRQSCDCKK